MDLHARAHRGAHRAKPPAPGAPPPAPEQAEAAPNFAKLRLNMLFAGTTEGAHRACMILGIVATCRAIGIPVQAYLAWAFEPLGTHRERFGLALDQITPAAFEAARG